MVKRLFGASIASAAVVLASFSWSATSTFASSIPRESGGKVAPARAAAPVSRRVDISRPVSPSSCPQNHAACLRLVLNLLNHERALHGVGPLALVPAQSVGTGPCVGSLGHSEAMARTGSIWHANPAAPRASFPRNICTAYTVAGENVGESKSGNAAQDFITLHHLMMIEPHSKATCATTVNHACNVLNPQFRNVGIGIYMSDGSTWLTEDFIG